VRVSALALVALVMAGCGSMPTQQVPSDAHAFQTQFLNLASITSQMSNMTNVAPNTQVNVPIQIAPVTQISALSWGSQTANPLLGLTGSQGITVNTGQYMDQVQANL
jgi:hypothetical protein